MSVRQLVVSADDFGVAPDVNQAVAEAHRDGVLTNASLMVMGAAAPEAVRLAHTLPALGVGLHLVLVQGRPAAPRHRVPRLLRADGHFRDAPVATGLRYAWLALGRRGAGQLRAEIVAQLDAFARTGLRLSHVDGHLNMHLHPMVLPVLVDLAPRYGLRALRLTREPLGRALRYDGRHLVRRSLEGLVFSALARFAAPRLRAAGIATPVRVYGMHQTGEVDAAYLEVVLRDLPEGTSEVYCHPAPRPAEELQALLSPTVRAAARQYGVDLVNYHALGTELKRAV
jgi:hopanoid biosynthesis associated protein HpnK